MTAVASPLASFQPSTRLGWSSNGSGFGAMNSDEVTKMFTVQGSRKTVQRQNSTSSIASTASSASTISASSTQASGGPVQPPTESASWAARKKPSRGLWLSASGKADPSTGLSTARPQPVSSSTSGPTASSAISALHAPVLPSQQMMNGNVQAMSALRDQSQAVLPAILHLLPINGTFERKTITVPYAPDVLRIGRQTNQKTIPTPSNGYFDSKVLSRQHAEIYADRNGRIFIRDVKSSNGTFVNGMRLSQENKESEPRELREQDVLELGIDIVSEDQKTVVHHKVAAKVEHAGIYQQSNDGLNFGELDPSAGPGLMSGPHQLKRAGSQGSINGRGIPQNGQGALSSAALSQPQHMRNWLNPITTEHIVRKLTMEMKLAMQQSQDIARARLTIENMLGGAKGDDKNSKSASEKAKASPTKSMKTQFSEPPAPPPQAPLPEKPDVARALADPIILPLLKRVDAARSPSTTSSPTRIDHSGDIIRLCEELKRAKGELTDQSERMRTLEDELAQERIARESAEERARGLEQSERRDSPTDDSRSVVEDGASDDRDAHQELQAQLNRVKLSMDEMKQQMELYRQRAEHAEAERDEARQSLAEMVEQKRKENTEQLARVAAGSNKSSRSNGKRPAHADGKLTTGLNGNASKDASVATSPTSEHLLEKAGIELGQPITQEQARLMTQYLAQDVLGLQSPSSVEAVESTLLYYGIPYGSFAAVIVLGYLAMTWVNQWPEVKR